MQAARASLAYAIVARRAVPGDLHHWVVPVAIVALVAVCAALTASDADWDLRNYHAYNAHALLSGRFWSDIAPAQLQTFYSPFLDIITSAVREALNDAPVLRNVVLSLPQGVAAALAFRLTLRVLPAALPGHAWLALAATLCSAAGAAGYPTLATAMSDALPGACILAGLLLLTGDGAVAGRRMLLAGVLFGIAGGLKLTTMPYCLAGAVAVFAAPRHAGGSRLSGVGAFVLGGLVAGALVGGPWWLLMYRHFGNPLLPYMNQMFRSPFVEPLPFTDTRFFPHGIAMALAYPFYWATQPRALASELPVRDARFAIAMIALAAVVVRALWRRGAASPSNNRAATMLTVFFAVTFVLWEAQFSVLRYLATLELLTGAMVLVALRPLLMRPATRVPVALGFLALSSVVQAMTIYPDWGRMAAPLPMRVSLPTTVEQNAMVVLLDGAPMAYLADLLPATVRLVGANNNLIQPGGRGLLAQQATAAIRGHAAALYGLEDPAESPGTADRTLGFYRLQRGECAPVQSNLDNNAMRWCRLWPRADRDDPGPVLQGTMVSGAP
jgi:hypothetical protein